jgi:hypothetical protein
MIINQVERSPKGIFDSALIDFGVGVVFITSLLLSPICDLMASSIFNYSSQSAHEMLYQSMRHPSMRQSMT